MARLKLDQLTKSYHGAKAVDRVSLDVADGEFLAVLGPSGCGKTTLLRLIAGFEEATSGAIGIGERNVTADGVHIPPEERRVGIVFQNYALWPHMTVAENIAYPLKVARTGKDERRRRVAEALALVEMTGYEERYPANLSGGQRQRVALARCLVAAPSLVLFDEPLANLDVHLRASMEDAFADFHKRTGTTVLYITHDQAEAMALADRIAVMDHGKVMQVATPRELYREPANAMVASFIASGIVAPGTVLEAERDGHCRVRVFGTEVTMRCRPGERPRGDAEICFRADDVERVAEGGFEAKVRRSVYRGGGARVTLETLGVASCEIGYEEVDPVTLKPGDTARFALRSGWVIPPAS